jgi:digalactosyldiacylglycerol synthase
MEDGATLCVPWIHPEEQACVFPRGLTFSSPAEQEAHIREWLEERDGPHQRFEIRFYPARYDLVRGSILPLGDTTKFCNPATDGARRDLCILEEPEHLNWYHCGRNWRRRFKLVVGVVHTNYIQYAKLYQPENVAIVRFINSLVCRAYCDRVVKLSDCLQVLPRSTVCNVHGVRSEFIDNGRRRASAEAPFGKGAYFIGKVLWAKGLRLLIDAMAATPAAAEGTRRSKLDVPIDIYGDGDDLDEVRAAAEAAGLELNFCGGVDHADDALGEYKVFVNPSQTEVLSTTTAEALAMGKFVVIERNPSNEFFYRFANALTYETAEEFRSALNHALASEPAPLTEEESRALSWEGATERFLNTVEESAAVTSAPSTSDELAHCTHISLSGWKGYFGDALKKYVFESGPVSRQRWLHKERKYRQSTSVVEIVDKSVAISPPVSDESWAERYGAEKKASSWTARFASGGKEQRGHPQ